MEPLSLHLFPSHFCGKKIQTHWMRWHNDKLFVCFFCMHMWACVSMCVCVCQRNSWKLFDKNFNLKFLNAFALCRWHMTLFMASKNGNIDDDVANNNMMKIREKRGNVRREQMKNWKRNMCGKAYIIVDATRHKNEENSLNLWYSIYRR